MSFGTAHRTIPDALRLRSFEVGEAEVRPPWGVRRPSGGWYHHFYVLRGAPCQLLSDTTHHSIALDGLTICMINDRCGHAFQDVRRSPIDQIALPMEAAASPCFRSKCYGGVSGDVTSSFYVGASIEPIAAPDLPSLIILRLDHSPDWLRGSIDMIKQEMRAQQIETAARLCEFLLLKTLQTYADHGAPVALQPAAMPPLDPRIARVIALIDENPARGWTLDALADAAGMSRARLTARWREALGVSVFDYIANRRLGDGAHRLVATSLDIGVIAHRAGFGSHAAFSTAFKRRYGHTPEQYRSRHRQAIRVQGN